MNLKKEKGFMDGMQIPPKINPKRSPPNTPSRDYLILKQNSPGNQGIKWLPK